MFKLKKKLSAVRRRKLSRFLYFFRKKFRVKIKNKLIFEKKGLNLKYIFINKFKHFTNNSKSTKFKIYKIKKVKKLRVLKNKMRFKFLLKKRKIFKNIFTKSKPKHFKSGLRIKLRKSSFLKKVETFSHEFLHLLPKKIFFSSVGKLCLKKSKNIFLNIVKKLADESNDIVHKKTTNNFSNDYLNIRLNKKKFFKKSKFVKYKKKYLKKQLIIPWYKKKAKKLRIFTPFRLKSFFRLMKKNKFVSHFARKKKPTKKKVFLKNQFQLKRYKVTHKKINKRRKRKFNIFFFFFFI